MQNLPVPQILPLAFRTGLNSQIWDARSRMDAPSISRPIVEWIDPPKKSHPDLPIITSL